MTVTQSLLWSATLAGSVVFLLIKLLSTACTAIPARWHSGGLCLAALLFLLPTAPLARRLLPAGAPVIAEDVPPFVEQGMLQAVEPYAADNAFSLGSIWQQVFIWLPLIWIIGLLLFGAGRIRQYRQFHRLLRQSCRPLAGGREADLMEQVKQEMGIHTGVGLHQNPCAATPMLAGLLRPVIILPDLPYERGQLELVLRHELHHLRHRDLWWKLLALAVCILHWFNPLCHLLARELDSALELACDEAVVEGLDGAQRKLYGRVILDALAGRPMGPGGVIAAMCLNQKQVKRRLRAMLNYKRPGRTMHAAAFGVALCLTVCGLGIGAAAYQPVAVITDPVLVEDAPSAPAPPVLQAEPAEAEQATGFIWPTAGGQVVGGVGSFPGHTGADIPRPEGTPVYAAASGIVVKAETSYINYGNHLQVDHGDGYQTLYAHLSTYEVEDGDTVAQGQVIGTCGRTGAATGYMLHFELRYDGRILDPENYVEPPAEA